MSTSRSVRLSKKGQLVIPKDMREALGVTEGDTLVAALEDGRVVLTPAQHYARATRGALKGTWGRSKGDVKRHLERERGSWR
jgi:AbrB family looped-hinge helix DNA binding protein